jgi:hypothetical protein
MFKDISLLDAMRRLASTEEWAEFDALRLHYADLDKCGDETMDFAAPQIARLKQHRETLQDRVRAKLESGEWLAEGFESSLGPQPHRIHPRFWKLMRWDMRYDGAAGNGLKFVSLAISQVAPACSTGSHDGKIKLRKRLISFIEQRAKESGGQLKKAELLKAAQQYFSEERITANLFQTAWQQADLPLTTRLRGRPRL